ncbi:serine protease [Methylacidiphilum caldifontis]|uniref:Serine protease n=2 Tax=Methylacidiphilum caldifontis TaxID=2795386 RepID=A0A4Y8PBW5_9BACT|nr:serine protease [Methylacidiphilum caldifontis]
MIGSFRMNKKMGACRLAVFCLGFFSLCFSFLQAQTVKTEREKIIYVIPIKDEIEQSMVYVVKRAINEAIRSGAQALVVDLDTPGGLAQSMEKIIREIERFPAQENTYAFIDHKAYSAGAFIAACCRHIYMAPGSVIGAASPVLFSPQGGVQNLPESYEKKILSAYQGLIRAIAERHGHNPAVFNAMVDRDSGLVIDGIEILPKGKILTLTDSEACKQYGHPPKALLAEGIVQNLEELAQKAIASALPYKLVILKPTGFEKIGRIMTLLGPIFLTLGLIFGYLELQTGGIVLGLLSLLFFSLYFLGHYLAGLSGWEPFFLFLLGLSLILFEFFVFPGLVIPTLIGFLIILVALLAANSEKIPSESFGSWLSRIKEAILSLVVTLGISLLLIYILSRFIPAKTHMILNEVSKDRNEGVSGLTTGMIGEALTVLRPSGLGKFNGKIVDVITPAKFVSAGTPIQIVQIEGIRVVVEPLKKRKFRTT